jgi:hypothetical protein
MDLKMKQSQISQTVTDLSLTVRSEKLLRTCSFSHFIELIKINDELKRTFYEVENTKEIFNPISIIKEPYILEFAGLETKEKYSENDNPPIGIILCTEKNNIKVEYTTAGLDKNLFVSKYKVALPSTKELEELVKDDLEKLEGKK